MEPLNPDQLGDPYGAPTKREDYEEIVDLGEESQLITSGVTQRRVPAKAPRAPYTPDEKRALGKSKTNMGLAVLGFATVATGISMNLVGAYYNMTAAEQRLTNTTDPMVANQNAAFSTEMVFYGQCIALGGAVLAFLTTFGNALFDCCTTRSKYAERTGNDKLLAETEQVATNFRDTSGTLRIGIEDEVGRAQEEENKEHV